MTTIEDAGQALALPKGNDPILGQGENPTTARRTAKQMLDRRREVYEGLIGKQRAERFVGAFLQAASRSPQLLTCTADSLYAAAHYCAMLGLMPGPFGHVYLTPRRNKHNEGRREIVVQTGYKGLMELARRHPDVRDVDAQVVYEVDEFDYDIGARTLHHKRPRRAPDGSFDDSNIEGAYSRVWLHGVEEPLILYLPREKIEERRALGDPGSTFWRNHYAAMARKTAVRAHYGGGDIPLNDDLISVLARENDIEQSSAPATEKAPPGKGVAGLKDRLGLDNAIDADYEEVSPEDLTAEFEQDLEDAVAEVERNEDTVRESIEAMLDDLTGDDKRARSQALGYFEDKAGCLFALMDLDQLTVVESVLERRLGDADR